MQPRPTADVISPPKFLCCMSQSCRTGALISPRHLCAESYKQSLLITWSCGSSPTSRRSSGTPRVQPGPPSRCTSPSPLVSAQIRRLERELGTVLLERTTRRVALDARGRAGAGPGAQRTRPGRGGPGRPGRAGLGDPCGQLRVGATQLLASIDLPRALAGFHRRYPGVTVALRSGLIADLLADLDAGRIDAALCPIHDDLPAAYLGIPLAAETVVLATPPGRHVRRARARGWPTSATSRSCACWAAGCAASWWMRPPPRVSCPASRSRRTARPASASWSRPGWGSRCWPASSARAAGQAIDVHPLRPELAAPAHRPDPAARPPAGPGLPGLGRASGTGLRPGPGSIE